MRYRSLLRTFYADATPERLEHVKTLLNERVGAESTFRAGVRIGDSELFLAVPRELSLLSERVLRHERKLDARLCALPPLAQQALVRGLVIDEVVSTNDLEGIHCTRRQINELIQSDDEGRDPLERRRFRGLARLYMDLYGNAPQKPTDPEDIRRIYDRVMDAEPLDERQVPDGHLFRKDGVEIYSPGGEVVHRGVDPEAVIHEVMTKMLALTNSEEIPEVYSAIMGHLIFEYTHPFYDGNGRSGRYLLALHLSTPLSTLTTLSLSHVLAENRGAY